MIFRPDRFGWLAAIVAALLSIAAFAAPGEDPLRVAGEAIEFGDGISAEVAAKRALETGVPPERVAPYMGEAELLQGNLGEARDWLESVEFAREEWERGYHALARLEMAEGDFAGANRAFEHALETSEGSALLWVDYGRLRYLDGEHHRALQAATTALERDPEEPRALEFRAQLVRDAEGLRSSVPWFERALKQAPDDVGLLGEYAATLGELGRYSDMLRVVRQLTEINPRNPRAYFLQASLAARAGKDDLARRLLWRTNGEFDQTAAGMLLTGVLELRAGNAAVAVDSFDELVRLQPENPVARELLGRALLANDEANEVIARLEPAANREDASPYLLTLVGRALEHVGDRERAAEYLDRATASGTAEIAPLAVSKEDELAMFRYRDQPERGDVARGLLRRMLSQGRVTEARAFASDLSERYPDSGDIEILQGDAAFLAGNYQVALTGYMSATEVRKSFPLIRRLVSVRRAMGGVVSIAEPVEAYLEQNPQSEDAAAMLGRLAMENGDWPLAAAMLSRAAGARGHGRDPVLLADLAQAQLKVGKADLALANAEQAYRLQRSNARAIEIYATTLEAAGKPTPVTAALLAKARSLRETASPQLR